VRGKALVPRERVVEHGAMTTYGYHASHEQLPPRDLLDAVERAEHAGFAAAMCSDHLTPWSVRQAESGFAWSWLGAALERTALGFGVVNAPGQRYHPVIIAQAVATLEQMYPGRFWVALGSGQAISEHVTGGRWPDKPTRNRRLRECVDVIRALLAGEEVSHDGLVTVDRARVWSLPATPPPLMAAAVSAQTAAWAAQWADGLITVSQPVADLRRLIGDYRDAGGRGDVYVQAQVSFEDTRAEALAVAHDQWRTNVFPAPLSWDLSTVEQVDQAAEHVPADVVAGSVFCTGEAAELIDHLHAIGETGVARVYVHGVTKDQSRFIGRMGEQVLPALSGLTPAAAGDVRGEEAGG
jgi:probable non-F420 flavinoid oxidoreductase